MNFLAHLHLAHLAESSLSGNLLADFVRGNPAEAYSAEVVEGIFMHRRIDVLTDNLPEVTEAKAWFRPKPAASRQLRSTSCGITSCRATGNSCRRTCRCQNLYAMPRQQVAIILPDSPPRFVNLNNYLWSERWLERYREMDFIQNVLNGMASRRPRLDALRDSWHDLDTHYDALESRFWQFYPRMMAQAKNKQL
ncbi:acyl carrier protein phosphodiesterase [Enterobacter cancerogenus]|uniref:Acyl carrier protein phosphodiesterase n=1 Tax=Enterobacter cancerogenus TaxID=69218 RepID=A0A484XKP3_9ENTR|nr:acyl carrier protein phosphodiesterase [Enterobacter cancerogenus]